MLKKYSARAGREAFIPVAAIAGRACLAAAALALVGSAFTLGSCAKKAPGERAATRQAAESAAPGAIPPGSGATPAVGQSLPGPPPRIAGDLRPSAAPKPAPPLAASMRAFGLDAPSVPRMPEDFSLGPLQSYAPAAGDEAAVFAVARAFMDDIAAGKLNRELLLPESRDALSLLLAPAPPGESSGAPSATNLSAYRLGAIALRGEDASLKVRLPRAAATAGGTDAPRVEGLLSLRKYDGSWYVEALALGPPEAGALSFAPDDGYRAK
jgi:hypothetical protein